MVVYIRAIGTVNGAPVSGWLAAVHANVQFNVAASSRKYSEPLAITLPFTKMGVSQSTPTISHSLFGSDVNCEPLTAVHSATKSSHGHQPCGLPMV